MTSSVTHRDPSGGWPAPGAVLASRYQVGEVIGRGGSSVIYRGKEMGLGRDVALKVLDVRDGSADEVELRRRRFYREARLMAQLNAASTVTMYDYGKTDEGLLFLVFEYVDGRTLEDKLKRGAVPPERARSILLQTLESLREAHAIGALHRDIKPSNIMLYKRLGQPDGVKVLDFGIAKHAGDGAEITHAGTVVGTPHYLAPERIRGEPATAASDIFALGLVTYAMLVGQSPVGHLRGTDAMQALTTQHHELPTGVQVDAQLRKVVNRMLDPRPAMRFQTIDEVLKALDVTLDPVTSDRTGHSIDNLVAFPLDFDPVGGTPVDELTGTTTIHSMTLTTTSIQPMPPVHATTPPRVVTYDDGSNDFDTTVLYDSRDSEELYPTFEKPPTKKPFPRAVILIVLLIIMAILMVSILVVVVSGV